MDDGVEDDDDHGSQHTSDVSSDSEGMDDNDEDIGEEGESDGNSIIDMLEEQQMEADQGDGAEGWTTDSASVDEGEDVDEEEDEDEFGGFPPPPIPVLDEDEMDYSDDDMDDGGESLEEVREMMGNLEDQIFDPLADDDDEDDGHMHHHHEQWLIRGRDQGYPFFQTHQFRGGLFPDNRARTTARRSGIAFFPIKLTV